eukprot:GHUV01011537.1.p1 GENE.GHUV01011537.1~~GHUV01011537.1.p1  ORF type:complete len:219 (+),score=28.03 GHUV01011537.1:146-802(+)
MLHQHTFRTQHRCQHRRDSAAGVGFINRHRHRVVAVRARAHAAGPTHTVLTGDIGGTNARLGLWECGPGDKNTEVYSETYPTSQFPTFEECLQAFLDEKPVRGAKVEAAAMAVAGAVENNRCPMTNITWVIDGKVLQQQFGFKTAVLNDFEAVGYGIPVLEPDDVVALNDVPMAPEAPKVVMGPGTGLGAAQLFWDSGLKTYKVYTAYRVEPCIKHYM